MFSLIPELYSILRQTMAKSQVPRNFTSSIDYTLQTVIHTKG
jgi:hypothetical protein